MIISSFEQSDENGLSLSNVNLGLAYTTPHRRAYNSGISYTKCAVGNGECVPYVVGITFCAVGF